MSNFNSEVALLRTYDLLVCALLTVDSHQGPTPTTDNLRPPKFSWSPPQ